MKFRYEVLEERKVIRRYEKELEAENYEDALKLIQTYGAIIGHTISEEVKQDSTENFQHKNIRRAYSSPRLRFLDDRDDVDPTKFNR